MNQLHRRSGPLGRRLAGHLLRRTTYQLTPQRLTAFANMTAEEAVENLFQLPDLIHPEGPVSYEDGVTAWLTTGPFESGPGNAGQRRDAVWLWNMNEALQDRSIRHKMAFFYHAIFVTQWDNDWLTFDLFRLFQGFALGNIRTLAYKVTLDNKMLRYLNNNTNNKDSPNENYAREFFELFTILKGETIATENYTNYTETDVVQAARVLTGFNNNNFANKDPETGLAMGRASFSEHDRGNKTFGPAFGNRTISGAVSTDDMYRELADFVAMIFEQKETARAFVRRLYRFFVSDAISSEVEQTVIEPLASQLYEEDYELSNTLKRLLKSQHFYDEKDREKQGEIIGGKIKSPLELVLTSINLFQANQLGVLNENPVHYGQTARPFLDQHLSPMGYGPEPNSVEGYPGFFKAPSYSKFWFDQATIASRFRLAYALLNGKSVSADHDLPFRIDLVPFFRDHFTKQEYAEELVRQLLEMALPELPDGERFNYYLQKLLGDLSPINWYFEWKDYLETGNDEAVSIALAALFEAVVSSPEFQTF